MAAKHNTCSVCLALHLQQDKVGFMDRLVSVFHSQLGKPHPLTDTVRDRKVGM